MLAAFFCHQGRSERVRRLRCGMVVIVMLLGHLYFGEGMRVICVSPYRANS